MLFLNALRCVGCGSGGLQGLKDYIVCPNCSRTYPVRADVPVMFSDATVIRGPLMDPAVVRGGAGGDGICPPTQSTRYASAGPPARGRGSATSS
ncbi:MAG: hypothetical protein WDN49_25100 [Acetobacteraceae bacterium]